MITIRLLQEQRFFAALSDDALRVLARITRSETFTPGETIFQASDAGRSLYLIRRGEVKVSVAAPDGEQFTLTILKDGDMFGAMSFVDETTRSATIAAISAVETLVIEKSEFEALMNDNPQMVLTVMQEIVRTAHSIVRGMNARYIEMITYMWGRKRFC